MTPLEKQATMSNTGINMRQALGTPPATAPAAWLYSPDVLPFTSAASDTTLLTTRYDTPFSQAPMPTQGNYVYVRGKNASTASQTATVYLYSVQHNPLAGMFSDFLSPSNWDSSPFTVGGTAGNSVKMTAANQNDVVLGATPLIWTPPAQESVTSEYILIAWIDPGGSPPPNFSSMQPFKKLDDVRQYVESQPNLVMLDTGYNGMFARQYSGQPSRYSVPGATWNSSPDIILYNGQPAYDTTLLQRALDWSVHQPAGTGANNLYIRGFHTSPGALTARVSFFYAVNNAGTNPNPLLTPANWKSDAMTVGGTAQNFVSITSNAPGDFMMNNTPVVWQPAAAPAGSTYAVIAWIDNTGGSNPPPFASLPAFSSLSSLAEYVQGNRNIVFWDGSVGGAFIRQFPGQTSSQPGTGALTSPDIIVAGTAAAQDASVYTGAGSYQPGTVSNAVTTGVPNFIYLRAINPNNGASSARVYLYVGDTTSPGLGALSPQGFTVGGKVQNWVDLQATSQNQVLVSTVPIVWVPPAPGAAQTQFLLSYIDSSPNPQPPDFENIGYVRLDAVTQFVATQPQLSWVSVTNTAPNPKPTFTYQYPNPAAPIATAGKYMVGVQFVNIPIDGTVTVSIPGPDAANTVVVPAFHPPSPNAAVVWTATYPANFSLSAAVSYWQGNNAPPQGANVTFVLVPVK
ncbi:MAG TPA: hypothetical protein VJU82_12345 [Acidobacteriaceae bacterium]|nr:hypothetical protein [Acidobacteriaceae bacterium]